MKTLWPLFAALLGAGLAITVVMGLLHRPPDDDFPYGDV